MAGKTIEVEESGRALKVHTHTPHLVSLGGGRWSTAVTLHQIPDGRQSVGSTTASDIVIKGKGVEPVHCYLENEQGSVTLYPIDSCDVTVDGTPLFSATKLTQGSTVCIGKNSSFRYNNPAEASVMKKSLSDSFRRKSSTKRPNKSSKSSQQQQHDSWDSLTSADELLANLISPKVFPSNSVTVNSPASFVLGPNKFPTHHTTGTKPPLDLELSNGHPSLSPVSPHRNITTPSPAFDRNPSYSSSKPTSAPQTPVSRNKTLAPLDITQGVHNGGTGLDQARVDLEAEQVRLEEILNLCHDYEKQIQWERNHKPQPNRIITNGSLPRDKRLHSPTIVPSPVHAQTFNFENLPPTPNNSDIMSNPTTPQPGTLSHPGSPRTRIKTTVGNNEYTSPSSSMKQTEHSLDILEKKLALLNDIELICSLNKTNGTNHNQYTQDKSTSTVQRNNTGNDMDCMSRSYHGFTLHSNGTSNGTDTMDNAIPIPTSQQNGGYKNTNYSIQEDPEPPDDSLSDVMSKSLNLGPAPLLEPLGSVMSRSFNGNPSLGSVNNQNNNVYTGCNQGSKATNKYLLNSLLYNNTKPNNKKQARHFANNYATLKKDNNINSETNNAAFYYTNSIDRRAHKPYHNHSLSNKQEILEKEKQKIEGLVTELEALVKSPNTTRTPSNVNGILNTSRLNYTANSSNNSASSHTSNLNYSNNSASSQSSNLNNVLNTSSLTSDQFILPLEDIDVVLKKQRASMNGDLDELKEKRGQLLSELNEIKANVQEIQQQEQELSRELEMEKAFLDAEWKAENDLLKKDERRVTSLKEKIEECEQQMDKCKQQQKERQLHCKQSLEQQQSVLKTLQQQLNNCADTMRHDLNESITQQQELLESEKKSFEDLEFSLLEEEADWLSRREELQRELNDATRNVNTRQSKLSELCAGRESIARNAADETATLNTQLMKHLRRIEETRTKLREVDATLKDISKIRGFEFTPASSDTEEDDHKDTKKQSQDDIDRISRVTSDAPIMETNSNSLGRRTIASLQEIEKHRQLHLAKQGSLVIEEERKRVLELKKRVQEEVKMQWENDHRKLNDELSPSETNDPISEVFDKLGVGSDHPLSSSSVSPDSMYSKSITSSSFRDQKEDRDPESRPMSDSSAYSEDQLSVRLRSSKSNIQSNVHRDRSPATYHSEATAWTCDNTLKPRAISWTRAHSSHWTARRPAVI
uniref:Pleckstrin homology-like domain family B member 1 n=1 Tax=Cacopsylla melanoneura TaxID=428564 RepID=A0A8D9F5S6_9HEMI